MSGTLTAQAALELRARTERELGSARSLLHHLVSESPTVIYALHVEGRTFTLALITENVERLAGYNIAATHTPDWWQERLHPDDRDRVLGELDGLLVAGRLTQEYRFLHKDGSYIWIRDEKRIIQDAAGLPVEAVGSWSDVSENKRLEAQLAQSLKLEAVARLAGGVAHDFNNLLGVIMGYSDLLLKKMGAEHPDAKRVEEIQKAAERGAGLTRQLLAFGRKQVLQPHVLDLNDVVADIEGMLRRVVGEDIRLVLTAGAGLGRIRADPGQIEQVLVSLAANACDAMPRGGGLVVETANVVLDADYARAHPEIRPGRFVMLSVSDTGEGMDEETQDHAFEPFFTTRAGGKASGLGLASVFGIVQQSGGSISISSHVGLGTICKIYFPRLEDASVLAEAAPDGLSSRGSETVLLVEDEAPLRAMIREILEDAGYAVLEAPGPDEALASLEKAAAVSLMLTDVVMPGMSGPDLAREVRRLRPEIKVLFMSGYPDDAVGVRGVLAAEIRFIHKPFAAEALLGKLREILDA